MAVVFSDTFNRADSLTVGNGWSEDQFNNTDVQISGGYLSCPTSDAGVAYQANSNGNNNTSITFQFQLNGSSASGAFGVSYNASSRNAVANNIGLDISTAGVNILDNNVAKGSWSTTLSLNTEYYLRWDINSDYSMKLYVNTTGVFTAGDVVATVAAFTPTSSASANYACGNRFSYKMRNLSAYVPVLSPPSVFLAPVIVRQAVKRASFY